MDKQNSIEMLREKLVGKTLDALDIMVVTDNYLEYDEGKKWIIDGGLYIEAGGNSVSFTYHDEASNNFGAYDMPLDLMLEGYDFYSIEFDESIAYDSLIGQVIKDVQVKNEEYGIQQYDGTITERYDVAVEFIIQLENEMCIQIATVNYGFDGESLAFKKVWYDVEGNMLVCLGEKIDVV